MRSPAPTKGVARTRPLGDHRRPRSHLLQKLVEPNLQVVVPVRLLAESVRMQALDLLLVAPDARRPAAGWRQENLGIRREFCAAHHWLRWLFATRLVDWPMAQLEVSRPRRPLQRLRGSRPSRDSTRLLLLAGQLLPVEQR